jgi:hypothetical protein
MYLVCMGRCHYFSLSLSWYSKARTLQPIDLYQRWDDRRESHLPPHLAFANLNRIRQTPDTEKLKGFLGTYGPPSLPRLAASEDLQLHAFDEMTDWPGHCRLDSGRLSSPAQLQIKIRTLWYEQQRFRALYLLWMGIRSNKQRAELAACISTIGITNVDGDEAILPIIAEHINRRIGGPGVALTGNTLQASWTFRTLREAMYTMFYWDIERDRPVHESANNRCGNIFAEAKSNIRYCSAKCERRTRLRKWWRNNGRQYRERKKRLGCLAE